MPDSEGLPTHGELYVHAIKTIVELRAEVKRLRSENADLRIALRVHSGRTVGTTKAQREAVVRGLKLCADAEPKEDEQMYPCEHCDLPRDGTDRFNNSGSRGHECIPELKGYVDHLKTDRNAWADRWTKTETARVNIRAEVQRLRTDAQTVGKLLRLGDVRLLAGDGPCAGRNAATALSAEESAELYQACQRIAAAATGGE